MSFHFSFYKKGMNCIYRCAAPKCYGEVYGDVPLEDGEIDFHRYRLFTLCSRQEQRNARLEEAAASRSK